MYSKGQKHVSAIIFLEHIGYIFVYQYQHLFQYQISRILPTAAGTNYRRLIDGRSIDISLGGIHNIVVGSDIDQTFQGPVSVEKLSGIIADGTGVKRYKGRKGELRAVIGVTQGTPWVFYQYGMA